MNWTCPVGVAVAGACGVTVTVNVTLSPKTVGDLEVVTVVVVSPLLTWVDSFASPQTVDVALLFVSPL
jgi:hypothetical protein